MAQGNIKVSVVMPVLNGMPYFRKALGSVTDQTMKEIEILVVDAGSDDGTVEYVQEIQKRDIRIRLLHSGQKSMGYQYNLGILEAKGEYVAFCESDDYVDYDMFETLYAAAERNDRPETVKSDWYLFMDREDTGEEFTFYHQLFPVKEWNQYDRIVNMQNAPMLPWAADAHWGIFSKKFLMEREIRFNETPGASFQDYGFKRQVNMLSERQLFLKRAFYHYRRDNTGSSVYKKDALRCILWECRYLLQFFEDHEKEKNMFFPYMLNNMIGQIGHWYGMDIYRNTRTEYEADLDEFIEYLRLILSKSTIAQRSRLWKQQDLYMLLNDRECFCQTMQLRYQASIENTRNFYNAVMEEEEVVVFGAGEMGRSLLAFLLVRGYQGRAVFCDNNRAMRDTVVMDCPVMSVEQTVHRYPDAVYCVPFSGYCVDMQRQLLQLGILADRIIESPGITSSMSVGLEFGKPDEKQRYSAK